jgi:thimet oligopeptidase
MWAEVFSADCFMTVFKKPKKLLNSVAGKHYRKCILAPGGSTDATEMLKNFLGREPNQTAFLELKGMKV